MRCILLILLISGTVSAQDFIVVTSRKTRIDELTSFQLRQIYLGKIDRLKGQQLKPLQLKRDDRLRGSFELDLFDPRFDLNQYWVTQKLNVGAEPPLTVGSWALLLVLVERNPGFIGYIPKEKATELNSRGVKIIKIEDVESR